MRKGKSNNGFAMLTVTLSVVSVASVIMLSIRDARFIACHFAVSACIGLVLMGLLR